ncbi:MAG: GTP 3',8-cyclase MoaA [Firmicutes bacterium]|nr:GTP 3',8-cyclase MoaA [Bacillota bacterium]
MKDNFKREINYLRISLTDRCNLRCIYCIPQEGVPLKPHEEILRLEEIIHLVKVAADVGISKVRLTGGEPLIRKGIVNLVRVLSKIPGIDDLAMTTNGILFPRFGPELKEAGLTRVNLSLDTLKPERFREITRGGDWEQAWKGVETALELGLAPVKLNAVIMRGTNDDEIMDFVELTYKYPLHIRFIEYMPIGEHSGWEERKLVTQQEMLGQIEKQYRVQPVMGIRGMGPAKYYNLEGSRGSLGFISPLSSCFCAYCNRLRLTADGRLRPCLHSTQELNLRDCLRSGASNQELAELFQTAIKGKPERHTMNEEGWKGRARFMQQIGG